MSHLQKPPVINGIGRRRMDKDGVSRSDNLNWRQSVRTPSNFLQGTNDGIRERLLYMHTCLVGQHVEVQKIDGQVYSGIFHSAIKDKEFGVILKMARLTKEGTDSFEGDSVKQAARKPPIRTYVIQGKDFVQIIAKDVSLSGDTLASSRARENRSELVTDSFVTQRGHRESERELKPWKPDDEFSDPTSIEVSKTWSGNWDQFEANKALFGVETTFDEELYTTKLVRGPQLREREREARRIAREIVGQQTRNVHLAEERGVQLSPELEAMDEETKYSSVVREFQDVGVDDEDQDIDAQNFETFGAQVPVVCANTSTNEDSCTPILADGEETSLLFADLQTVREISRAENLRECPDLAVGKEDAGSPDSLSDSCKDHLRLRKLLVSDKSKHCNKGSGSPYNSPIGRGSPLLSPLAGDAAGIKALNLDSSCPQVPDDVYREFKEFKQQKHLEALKALSESFKKELEPRSLGTQVSVPAVTASKKSPLNVNPKDFKLNPNAKSFTPSSCSTRLSTSLCQHPLAAQSPTYMNSIVPAATVIQGSLGNFQSIAQQNQYSQYTHPVASGIVAIDTSYMASPGGPVPGFPVGGVGGGGLLPGQAGVRLPSHSQQQAQAMSSYGHPQQAKYHPPTSALHSGLLHPNGQLYPPHMMYGQPTNPVVYMPFHQGMLQGHSIPSLGQGRLCSQPQQCQPQNR